MNQNAMPPNDSWEDDAVWQLLDRAPPAAANTHFTDDTVRAARLAAGLKPWWSSLLAPFPLAGIAATAAAVALAVVSLVGLQNNDSSLDSPQAIAIQDCAEAEILVAAADQLEDFSDHELVCLIGF